jgi:hypothetical protein
MTNLALRREIWLLNYFTEGSVPEAYAGVPESWTPDQIKQAQNSFDSYLAGNLKNRRKVIFGPDGKLQLLKAGAVGGDAVLDELIIRFFCFAFKISAQALVKMMNRATAGTAKEHAIEEGLLPRMMYVKGVMDSIITTYCGIDDLEFAWQDEKEEDPAQAATIISTYVKLGVMTVNEGRDKLGLDPVEGGDKPLVYTATGAMLLTEAVKPPAPIDEGGAAAGANAGQEDGAQPGAVKPQANAKPAGAKSGGAAPGSYAAVATDKQRAAEARMRKLLEAFFAEQGPKLAADAEAWAARQTKAAKAADDNPPFDQKDWDALVEKISAELQIGFGEAVDQALNALDANDDALWAKIQPRAVRFADDRAAELVTQISETTRDGIRALVKRSLEDGLNPQQLKKAIQESTLFDPDRADMIARTELAKSHVQGTLAGWKESGLVAGYNWLCDVQPCVECQDNAEAGTVKIGELFPSGDDGPPAHPNCECALSPVLNDEMEED